MADGTNGSVRQTLGALFEAAYTTAHPSTCLPPHLPPGMEGFPYVAGWGVFDQARLYISRGVGMMGLPLRFRCRPEVALFTLRRGDGAPMAAPGISAKVYRKVVHLGEGIEKIARRLG